MFRIAIQPDSLQLRQDTHQSFSERWIELLEHAGHEVRLVDVFGEDFFERLRGCDGFLWWFPPIPAPRNFAKRLMFALSHASDLCVFPDWKTCWHFDDKVAQGYLLQAAGIPIPRTWVLWHPDEARDFCRTAQYPLVIKLASGVYSQNVRLLRSQAEAEYWVSQLFSAGLCALERPPASPLGVARGRLRAAARALVRGRGPDLGGADIHKDYLLVQEFLPGNDYDTRVSVIGNRAFGVRRYNRPGDFRASGSGNADFDPALVDEDAVRLAFRTVRALAVPSLCVDVLRREGEPVIGEVSYYYEGWTIHRCPGHWALQGDPETGRLDWVAGAVRPEDAMLEDFLAVLRTRTALTRGDMSMPS